MGKPIHENSVNFSYLENTRNESLMCSEHGPPFPHACDFQARTEHSLPHQWRHQVAEYRSRGDAVHATVRDLAHTSDPARDGVDYLGSWLQSLCQDKLECSFPMMQTPTAPED